MVLNSIFRIKQVLAKEYDPLTGIGPLGLEGNAGGGPTMFAKILSIIVGVMTFVAGIWFVIKVITAGYTLFLLPETLTN